MRAYLTVLDGNADLVPYFVRHYQALGATCFPVLVYADDPGELVRVCGLVEDAGGTPLPMKQFGSDGFSAKRRDHFLRDHHPTGEWAFFCDLDEFAELTAEEVERWKHSGCKYVAGRWLDRVSADGRLADPVPGQSLESVYPMGTRTRHQLGAGDWVYVMSRRGPDLHHPNVCQWGKRYLKRAPVATVHHFKWSTGVIRRLERRIERIDAMPSNQPRRQWRIRVQATLDYLRRHGGGVDPAQLEHVGPRLGI